MAKDNFEAVMTEVFSHEGGYVNHRKDPGGETNYGISKRSYPKENIRSLTKNRAKFLYRRDFWNPVSGDYLPIGVDLVTMDSSVNSGLSRGTKWTQQAAGLSGKSVDGVMGPASVRAISVADPIPLIRKACALRMGFLHGLRTWGTFGKGWSRRVASVEAVAVAMAAKAIGSGGYVRSVLAANGKTAKTAQTANTRSGHATTVTGAGGAGGTEMISGLPDWAPLVVFGALVVIAIWFYGKSRHEASRAEAYKIELEKVA